MAKDDRTPPSSDDEESDTIRALRSKYPELAAGERVKTPQLSPAEALHSREAAMGIPNPQRGKVMIPKDPEAAAHLPPAEDGFRDEPVFEEGMDREAYDKYRASIPPISAPVEPVASPPQPPPQPPDAALAAPPAPVEELHVAAEAAPARHTPPTPQQKKWIPPTNENPILIRLKQNLGIDPQEQRKVEINGMIFTLRLANARVKSYAASAPSVMDAMGELHWGLYHLYGLASVYIVGIDNTPLYHVLGVKASVEEHNAMERTNHFDPPYSLVLRTVPEFFDLLLDQLRDGLAAKIVEKYDEAFESENVIKAYNDDGFDRWRYECPQLNCDDTYSSIVDGAYFCRRHGTRMIPTEEAGASKVPLA